MEAKPTTIICSHCERAIPLSSTVLHSVHCSRFLEKCKTCGDMVPKKHAEEHFLNTHAPVTCSRCGETVDRDIISVHNGEQCPNRMVSCEFCEFPLPAIDLRDHQDVCGNRTNLCYRCNKYIKLREMVDHVSQCDPCQNDQTDDSSSDGEGDSSSDSSSDGEGDSSSDSSSDGEGDSSDDSSSDEEGDSTGDSSSDGEGDSSDDSSSNGEEDSADDSSTSGEPMDHEE